MLTNGRPYPCNGTCAVSEPVERCKRNSSARTKDLVGKVRKGERHDGVPRVAYGDDGEDAVDPHAVAAQQAERQRQSVHMARHQHPREVVPAATGELDVHLQAVEDQH